MSTLDIIIGKQSKTYTDNIDEDRVIRREPHRSSMIKAHKARKEQVFMENQLYEEAEEHIYYMALKSQNSR